MKKTMNVLNKKKWKNIPSFDSSFCILAHEFISELNSETKQFLGKRFFPTLSLKKLNNFLNFNCKGLFLHEPIQYGRQQTYFSNFILIFWEFKMSDIERSFPITTQFLRYKYGIVMVPLSSSNIQTSQVPLLWIIGTQMVFSFTKGN